MLKKNQLLNKLNLFYIPLVILTILSLGIFWKSETNEIFRLGIGLLTIFSLWRVYVRDKSPLVYLIIFLDTSLLFKFVANQALIQVSIISVVATFVLIISLFIYHHLDVFENINMSLIGFASLASLMVAEIFFILTFFPIEPESKAILIVLFAWLIDEIMANFKLRTLNRGFLVTVVTIFFVIFGTLAITFPFKIGF